MELPLKRSYPIFHSVFEKSKLLGFKSIEKSILRGHYKSIQSLEEDVRIVLTSFASAFESEKPEAAGLVDRLKKIYKEAKQKAMLALDPFIVPTSSGNSGSPERPLPLSGGAPVEPRLPKFMVPEAAESEDRVRCICGTFSEEGTMVQCEKCFVWQHCDCVGLPYAPISSGGLKNSKRGAPKKAKVRPRSPVVSPPKPPPDVKVKDEAQVEFDSGEIVGVGEELPIILEPKEEEAVEMDFAEMETQVIVPLIPEVPMETEADETRETPYYCEECQPRDFNPEVRLGGQNDTPDRTYYLTLKREDGLMLRKNDTVYVLRDWPVEERVLPDGTPRPRITYLNAGSLVKEQCDIFRIDSLWKDAKWVSLFLFYFHFSFIWNLIMAWLILLYSFQWESDGAGLQLFETTRDAS